MTTLTLRRLRLLALRTLHRTALTTHRPPAPPRPCGTRFLA
ncbi:hypothetical protein ACF1D2_30240 [Streptomyces bacillaris]